MTPHNSSRLIASANRKHFLSRVCGSTASNHFHPARLNLRPRARLGHSRYNYTCSTRYMPRSLVQTLTQPSIRQSGELLSAGLDSGFVMGEALSRRVAPTDSSYPPVFYYRAFARWRLFVSPHTNSACSSSGAHEASNKRDLFLVIDTSNIFLVISPRS